MMSAMKKRLHHFNAWFDASLEQFMLQHKLLGFLTVFIGMPLFILAAVFICTIGIVLPMAWIFGVM
ncbi:Uncharacterised protein [uncultured Flavonifractor sp.]|jgi:hypothetical protein|nr:MULTISPECIES: hypothetical protein [Eubacteriales]MCU6701865.1 hypothetical protein [Muriventricola aceti]SCG91950.1 Uncharacterised protein [uncultured Clostridium sp.]SCI17381.1 Uncharacterised protein [uncultured Flavonifractor sp.]SCI78098.1 Uncharacterised protein [uncultured Flavonifractor sp.]